MYIEYTMAMSTKKIMKCLLLISGVLALILIGVICQLYLSFHRTIDEPVYSNGPNAVWAGHEWVGTHHSVVEYQEFIDHLKRNGITDVFLHVGPWNETQGGIPESKYPFARELLAKAEAAYPGLRMHAWIGQMTTGCGGPLDLSFLHVREDIVQTAETFLDMGFHGIHYDFEPIASGDRDYLDLLARTRAVTVRKNGLLSVASGHVEIAPRSRFAIRAIAPCAGVWTQDYFLDVSSSVDQIAVMLYDTGLPADWLFGMYVKKQTSLLVPLLESRATLFFGIPTYEESSRGHRPRAENIGASIKGIQLGLNALKSRHSKSVGIAVYADWTTDEKEWRCFREKWLGRRKP